MSAWRLKKVFFFSLIVISSLLIITLGFYLYFTTTYDDKVYPGVSLGDLNLGGQSFAVAQKLVADRSASIMQSGLQFSYNNQVKTINPGISVLNIETSGPIVDVDAYKTVDQAYNYGRNSNFFSNLMKQISALIFSKKVTAVYSLDEAQLKSILIADFQPLAVPVVPADLDIKMAPTAANGFTYNVKNEQAGQTIKYDEGITMVRNNLDELKMPVITLVDDAVEPQILKSQVPDVNDQIAAYLNLAPVTLQYNDDHGTSTWKFKIDKAGVAAWLSLARADINDTNSPIQVTLSPEKISSFLDERVGKQINRDPVPARFIIKNGKVSSFQNGEDGLKVNDEQVIAAILKHFADKSSDLITLAVDRLPDLSTRAVDNMGIKEIIGTGHSNFVGSPVNRRHNIAVGSAAVNGLLIKPGDEFSLVKALGNVDASTGYLPELVIKDNKTVPEDGGGLCQVGTTLFRAALESGLPITERHNHSYRVSYYEPAGMDAAVYLPQPDVKFVNDTGNYILIQTRTSGNDLYFDFWGVKDGRQVKITKPVVYNIVKPAPAKTLETLDLKPGEKKCTEHAHDGADAYFDYTVTYPVIEAVNAVAASSSSNLGASAGVAVSSNVSAPAVKTHRFASHYTPWQEVCLIGVKQLSSSTPITTTAKSLVSTSTKTTSTVIK